MIAYRNLSIQCLIINTQSIITIYCIFNWNGNIIISAHLTIRAVIFKTKLFLRMYFTSMYPEFNTKYFFILIPLKMKVSL